MAFRRRSRARRTTRSVRRRSGYNRARRTLRPVRRRRRAKSRTIRLVVTSRGVRIASRGRTF